MTDSSQNPQLERYLSTLERVLQPFPVGDRAEIVTEIRSHILSALERDPSQNLKQILGALGEPEVVANRYLIERGLKPTKPAFHPVLKWIVFGFLGAFALLLIFIGVVIYHFTPLVQMDSSQNSVSLFGGNIQVNSEDSRSFLKDILSHRNHHENKMEGTATLTPGHLIRVEFATGHLELSTSKNNELTWTCTNSAKSKSDSFLPELKDKEIHLDFRKFGTLRCDIVAPVNTKIDVTGLNGRIFMDEPGFSAKVQLTNGRVNVAPDSDLTSNFKVTTDNGKADTFPSSQDKNALQFDIHVLNGNITLSDGDFE